MRQLKKASHFKIREVCMCVCACVHVHAHVYVFWSCFVMNQFGIQVIVFPWCDTEGLWLTNLQLWQLSEERQAIYEIKAMF